MHGLGLHFSRGLRIFTSKAQFVRQAQGAPSEGLLSQAARERRDSRETPSPWWRTRSVSNEARRTNPVLRSRWNITRRPLDGRYKAHDRRRFCEAFLRTQGRFWKAR